MKSLFVTRDSKGKIRVIALTSEIDENGIGHIYRSSGLLKGKATEQPTIDITEGKVKRDIKSQTQLKFMSLRKGYLDKGYVELQDDRVYSDEEIETIVGSTKTNQEGVIKPMLAKQADKVTNKKVFDLNWLASRKLDGVRALVFMDKDGFLHAASRGGGYYDVAISHILTEPKYIEMFKVCPTMLLDGEIYVHGVKLQDLSGAARREDKEVNWLEYFVYDVYIPEHPDMSFINRLNFINSLADRFGLKFDPNHTDPDYKEKIHVCPHVEVSGWDNIKQLHDEFVLDGYEGVVIRNPNKEYKPGARDNRMLKIKSYSSFEAPVIGYNLGLRGSEDMTFTCQLSDGSTFEAMPCADRETKAEYVENFETKYKGHLAEITYFVISRDGKPQQPKMRTWRFDLENK